MKSKVKIEAGFAGVLLLVAALWLPYWSSRVIPGHDTIALFHQFYYFYNQLFFDHSLALWLPYGYFGITTQIFQLVMTPASYLVMVLGALFGVTDAMAVFKAGIFLEYIVLAAGTWKLGRYVYRERATAFFVTLGILASSIWIAQIFFNFRIFYMFPYVLYFFLRFSDSRRPHYLWLAGICGVFSLYGVVPYFAPFYFLITLLFAALFLFRDPGLLRTLVERRRENLLCFCLFAGLVSVYLLHALNMFDGLKIYYQGRDPETGLTPISVFLKYGGQIGLAKFVRLFFAGDVFNNHTLYMGFLPLAFLLYGFSRVTNRIFAALCLVLIFLFAFSLADSSFVARTSYHFSPLMNSFRHIGLVGGLFRLFFLLAAGFGLDAYLKERERRVGAKEGEKTGNAQWIIYGVFCVIAAILFIMPTDVLTLIPSVLLFGVFIVLGVILFVNDARRKDPATPSRMLIAAGIAVFMLYFFLDQRIGGRGAKLWPEYSAFAIIFFVFTLFALASPARRPVAILGILAVVCLGMDLLSYQNLVAAEMPKLKAANPDVISVQKLPYQATRWPAIPSDGSRSDLGVRLYRGDNTYSVIYGFLQVDPCIPGYGTGFLAEGVDRFMRVRGSNPPRQPDSGRPDFPATMMAMGCSQLKLFLTRSVAFAASSEEADVMVERIGPVHQVPVIEHALPEDRAPLQPPQAGESAGEVKVIRFEANRLEAEVEVSGTGDAWLYYADAWHSGWTVSVDGEKATLLRANHGFKAVRVPEGKHSIEFQFKPFQGRMTGYGLFLSGILFMLFVIWDGARMLMQKDPVRTYAEGQG